MKQFRANAIEKQAETTEELLTTLTENNTKQMETLIKSMTKTMKDMMQHQKQSIDAKQHQQCRQRRETKEQ